MTAGLVLRERLLTRLADSGDRSVVVISGPAGSGKSTLAAQFRVADDRTQAAVRLAGHDNEAVVLAGRLLDALEELGPAAPSTRASVTAVEPGFSAVLLPAFEQLAASRGRPYLLVVDDVHLLHRPQCLDLLLALANGVPRGSSVLLLTREETPAWLARVRAERRLLEVGPTDLAFDVDEATLLFADQGLRLSPTDVTDLVEHAEGWAVGLYLSALAMQGERSPRPGGAGSPPHGSDRFILDYVRSEVLDPLPADERTFLVRTAVLDELSPSLCNAVTDRQDSAGLLAVLHRRSQLVVATEEEGQYRCHHLLREALLTELERGEPELVPVLHARAARRFDVEGDLDAAVRHAKAAADLALVAELVWKGILGCVASGRPDRLALWLSDVSEHDIGSDAWLTLAAAWSALQAGDDDRMQRWLLRAQGHAGRDWRARMHADEYAASLAVLEAVVGAGGLEDSIALSEGALSGLPPDSGFRAVAAFIRGVCLTLLRRPELGRLSLVEAEALARALDVPLIEADALSWQGVLAVLAGETNRGSQLIGAASELIARHHLDRLATSAHCITAQSLLLALQRSPDSEVTLARARRLTALVPEIAPWFAVCGRLVQARAAVLLGDGALARILLTEARAAMTGDLAASLAGDLFEDAVESLRSLSRDGVSAAALTAAEMRVLQFLPGHLTFRLIGEHLFLSQNTVKTHAMSIYRKLGVASRAEAVTTAQSLGLVESPPRE